MGKKLLNNGGRLARTVIICSLLFVGLGCKKSEMPAAVSIPGNQGQQGGSVTDEAPKLPQYPMLSSAQREAFAAAAPIQDSDATVRAYAESEDVSYDTFFRLSSPSGAQIRAHVEQANEGGKTHIRGIFWLPKESTDTYEAWLVESASGKHLKLGALTFDDLADGWTFSFSTTIDVSSYDAFVLEGITKDGTKMNVLEGFAGAE